MVVGVLLAGACRPAAAPSSPAAAVAAPAGPATSAAAPDPAFPAAPTPAPADPAARARLDRLADDYVAALTAGKTPPRWIAGLVRRARDAGATPLEGGGLAAGDRRYWVARGGDAAAFLRVGRARGLRVVVAASDAPRLDLKQRPAYDAHGATMLDTEPYGEPPLETWLARPLALYLRLARPGAAPLDVAIGDDPADPTFVVPDVLPHLSRRIQAKGPVDGAERLDALAAIDARRWAAALRARGLPADAFVEGEASLVPAGPAHRVGTDRGWVGGYGQARRALGFVAVAALAGDAIPAHDQLVIVVSKAQIGGTGSSGTGFVRAAMVAALDAVGVERDALAGRRILARTDVLLAAELGGEPGKGVVVGEPSGDTLPAGVRRALDRLEAAAVAWQRGKPGWGVGRELGALDVDALELGLPIEGADTPGELLRVDDLGHAAAAATAWLGAP
jgi:hypothetical protein